MGKRRSLEQVEGLWDDESQSYILPDVDIVSKPMSKFRKGFRKAMRTQIQVPAAYPNPSSIATWQYNPNNLVDTTVGKELAHTAALVGAVPAMTLASAAWANPMIKGAVDVATTIDSGKNLLSDNGVSKTIDLAKQGDIKGAVKSGIGDLFDILGTGHYLKGVDNRLSELLLRQGDDLLTINSKRDLFRVLKRLTTKEGVNYTLNPLANPNLAYKVGKRYGGLSVGGYDAKPGDVIDQFINKNGIDDFAKRINIEDIPEELQGYFKTNYPRLKNVRYKLLNTEPVKKHSITDWTYTHKKEEDAIRAANPGIPVREKLEHPTDFAWLSEGERAKYPYPIRSGGVSVGDMKINGIGIPVRDVSVLDPGGYNAYGTRIGNNILLDNYDIYKFNPKDLNNSYRNTNNAVSINKFGLIKSLGAKHLDKKGEPILFHWKEQVNNFPFIFDRGGIVNIVNKSRANFVSRLKDPNRRSIKDWQDSTKIATHKLGVGTDNEGNHYIYPEVQEINGKLIDFTRPPYLPTAGRISAEEKGDTVRVKSFEDALEFTENYKKYYPNFK